MTVQIQDGSLGASIAADRAPLIIAELSGNHNGELERAVALVREAAKCRVDMVKLQTYTADTITMDSPHPSFAIESGPWAGRRLYQLYQEASTPWEWHAELFSEARRAGLIPFSSPFDSTAVEFLEALGCSVYKVASFEVVDTPLLRAIGATRKPVIMSTGMASLEEVDEAVEVLREAGTTDLVLLHCISSYPADPASMRLQNIKALRERYGCSVGLSDHSLGHHIAVAAIAIGAEVIEKHLTLARADGGPDASFSMEPNEMEVLVTSVREAFGALAQEPDFALRREDRASRAFRKSLYFARDLSEGHLIEEDDLRVVRPAAGLRPRELPRVIGSRLRTAVRYGDPVVDSVLLS